MSELSFATATPEQLEACAAIVGTTELYARYGRDTASALTALERAHGDPKAEVLVARLGDAVAGFAWMVMRGAFDAAAYLRLIAVAEDHRGQRIGERILAELERRYGSPHGLFLLVSDFNEAAQRFYERLGYAHIGTVPAFVNANIDELIYFKACPES